MKSTTQLRKSHNIRHQANGEGQGKFEGLQLQTTLSAPSALIKRGPQT